MTGKRHSATCANQAGLVGQGGRDTSNFRTVEAKPDQTGDVEAKPDKTGDDRAALDSRQERTIGVLHPQRVLRDRAHLGTHSARFEGA